VPGLKSRAFLCSIAKYDLANCRVGLTILFLYFDYICQSMQETSINIVAFDIPYPPIYGGTIDIFYKLKMLKRKGIRVILHCFEYNKTRQKELENYCVEIYYYPRKKGLAYQFSKIPYIVYTRNHKELLAKLNENDFPILFEGLHTCFYLNHPELRKRKKMVRAHNVEHEYYKGLQLASSDFLKKIYFELEYRKLKKFENILHHADLVLSISEKDQNYFSKKYKNSALIPAFHPFDEVKCKTGRGNYFLYHGKLSVEENKKAALYLIGEVFSKTDAKLIVAGSNPDKSLIAKCTLFSNVQLISDPSTEDMNDLIMNAQACVLPTFQSTGLKLKLLVSLFASRFVIVNSEMIQGTPLGEACELANSTEEFVTQINNIRNSEFNQKLLNKRKSLLEKFSNERNAEKLLKTIQNT